MPNRKRTPVYGWRPTRRLPDDEEEFERMDQSRARVEEMKERLRGKKRAAQQPEGLSDEDAAELGRMLEPKTDVARQRDTQEAYKRALERRRRNAKKGIRSPGGPQREPIYDML